MNINVIWDNFLEKIKAKTNSLSYNTWFKNTKLLSLDNGVAIVKGDTAFTQSQLQDTWYDVIVETFNELTNTSFNFKFVLEDLVEDIIEEESSETIQNIDIQYNTAEKSNLLPK